jgi:hypothetical protein
MTRQRPRADSPTLRLTHERTDHVGARHCRHRDRTCGFALAYRSVAQVSRTSGRANRIGTRTGTRILHNDVVSLSDPRNWDQGALLLSPPSCKRRAVFCAAVAYPVRARRAQARRILDALLRVPRPLPMEHAIHRHFRAPCAGPAQSAASMASVGRRIRNRVQRSPLPSRSKA